MPVRVFDEKEIDLIREVFTSGQLSVLSGGKITGRFEAAFAEAMRAKHAVAMNAAMSVLHASVAAAGAGAGDEVICDPVCVFGAVAAMYNNAVPVFVDIDPITMNMNPDLIEAKITERTKALIVTHIWGLPAEMDRIMAIARKHNIIVIEDCAHALFATYKGRYVGTWGDVGSFSFQMSKQMGLGDGGIGITDNEEIAKTLGLFGGAPTFAAVAYGLHWNYRMTEQTAAIGLVQLERARGYIAELIEIARLYDEAVKGCDWLPLQQSQSESQNTYHFWTAIFRGEGYGISMDDFRQTLQEEKANVSIGYTGMPAYKHPLLQERLGYGSGCPLDCPLYTGSSNRYPDGLCPVAEDTIPRAVLVYTFYSKEYHQQNAEALHRAVAKLG
ncbi:MAG: DegT/DnrJ/EryC1/StrS family aminotransferase [Armatimonadetes bacterium]|nr:DegT/DnrJ/EryC1/StrS family aminotransferase [Armatimonadota bacterium]